MLNRLVIIFLTVALLLLGFYGIPVVVQGYRNAAMTGSVKAENVEWSTRQINDEEWRPVAHFRYLVGGRQYENTEIFQGRKGRNPYAVESDFPYLKEEYQTVWYAPRDPQNSTLEKFFPTKRAIYAAVLFALLFYSVWGVRLYLAHVLKKSK
jgi:hypothetical protein